jgi:hypothetical protein
MSLSIHQLNRIMIENASANNLESATFYKNLGANDFNGMLQACALAGLLPMCEQAIAWGATNFNGMLIQGAYINNVDIVNRAIELGANDFNHAMVNAGRSGSIETCTLMKNHGATDFAGLAHAALAENQIAIYMLAHQWSQGQ